MVFEPMSQHHWIESAAMPHWPNAVSAGTKVPENENGKKCFTSFINLCPWPWLSTDIKKYDFDLVYLIEKRP